MKIYFISLILVTLFFVASSVLLIHKLYNLSEVEAQASLQVPTQCIGQELTRYLNAVLGEADPQKIKLASPIFNLTNPAERDIFSYMDQSGARFQDLDAFAGNTYSLNGVLAYDWYAQQLGWAPAFEANGGLPVIFAEFGDFDQNYESLKSEFNRSSADSKIIGINFFNAAGTGNNDEFGQFIIPSPELVDIISTNPTKGGINTANTINSGHINTISTHSNGLINWTVQIATGPDVNGTLEAIENALSQGIENYFIRLCFATGCGFTNPSTLSSYITGLDQRVPDGINVYISLGPNEPATERWATPNCTTDREYTLREIACSETQDPEFHSLRPYPASPTCDPSPDGVWLCGNDLIVRHTYEVGPEDGVCVPQGQDQQLCEFNVQGSADVYMDLTDADFPIAGNTEDVPNAASSASSLSDARRVNEYVSWYLNGIVNRAEESPINPGSPLDVRTLIDFSGPLRKLLPSFILSQERREELLEFNSGSRHNQIIECGGNSPTPCYDNPDNPPSRLRITDQGNDSSVQFPYTPFSSTEDKTGQIMIGNASPNQQRPGPNGIVSITNVNYSPSTHASAGQESSKNLFFPHLAENNELSNTLQLTYKPYGYNGVEGSWSDPNSGQLPYCEMLESRDNDGDSLYGENIREGGESFLEIERDGLTVREPQIKGSISYNANFTCVLSRTELDLDCYQNECIGKPTHEPDDGDAVYDHDACVSRCTADPKCEVPVPVGFAVAVRTPQENDTIWDRLVGAHMSVFRRIFPMFGENTPIEKLEDIPGKTTVEYGAENHNSGPGDVTEDTLAGDPTREKPGTQAQLFFPHLGSIQDYFLHGIQEALRPYGTTTSSGPIESPDDDSIAVDPAACQTSTYTDMFGDLAEKIACLARNESRTCTDYTNTSCTTIGGTADYSYGPFQINLMAHPATSYVVPPGLRQMWDEAGVSPNVWSCRQGFDTIGQFESQGGVLRMKQACVPGTSTEQLAILNACKRYFTNTQNAAEYVKMYSDRFGFAAWATASSCNLL